MPSAMDEYELFMPSPYRSLALVQSSATAANRMDFGTTV